MRAVRSFVRRGRITAAQRRALDEHLWKWRLRLEDGPVDVMRTFGRRAPLTLEIGFGDGESLLALAHAHPERDFIGVDVHASGIGHLLLGLERNPAGNLRIYREDVARALEQCLPEESLAAALTLFPDPWPKKRHHKRRLLTANFADLLVSRLAPGGFWQLALDWPDYIEVVAEMLDAHPQLKKITDGGYERFPTRFERRAWREGRKVREFLFQRCR